MIIPNDLTVQIKRVHNLKEKQPSKVMDLKNKILNFQPQKKKKIPIKTVIWEPHQICNNKNNIPTIVSL